MIEKTCEICGKPFFVKPYRQFRARFCSQSCGGKWHMRHRRMRGPSLYGNTLRKGKRPANAFPVGHNKGKRLVKYITIVCENCGKAFEQAPWMSRQNKTRYCSSECHFSHSRGENHPRYVGGPRTYRGRGWIKQRLLVAQRDNGTCQQCGVYKGLSIPVHHITPYRAFSSPEEANRPENLICLCQSCHMKKEPPLRRADLTR